MLVVLGLETITRRQWKDRLYNPQSLSKGIDRPMVSRDWSQVESFLASSIRFCIVQYACVVSDWPMGSGHAMSQLCYCILSLIVRPLSYVVSDVVRGDRIERRSGRTFYT